MKFWTKTGLLAVMTLWILIAQVQVGFAAHPLIELVEQKISADTVNSLSITELRTEALRYVDKNGRTTPELQDALLEIEARYFHQFSQDFQIHFQGLLAEIGAKMKNPIQVPTNQVPFWLTETHELKNFRSHPQIPKNADIVIIGAGLTGASAAYHLREAAQAGLKIILLEADQPAAQASGRNGGNFQLLPESYLENYEGLVEERVKLLQKAHPTWDESKILAEAERLANILLQFSLENFHLFRQIVVREKINCDISLRGWLRKSDTQEEESALQRDNRLVVPLGQGVEFVSPEKVKERYSVPAKYKARFSEGSGNYHPFKFVCGVLKKASESNIELYMGVRVSEVKETPQNTVAITTSEGQIEAKKIIIATNAFTTQLFPKLKDVIQCVPSQIMNLEHVSNTLNGITITERYGDIYYNFPKSRTYRDETGAKRGMLHFGLDFSYATSADPSKIQVSKELFHQMKEQTDHLFPETQGQPPSRVWTGPMALTPDRVPLLGFYQTEGRSGPARHPSPIILAVGFQGYGGSYCIFAGKIVAGMALKGKTPASAPAKVFSPNRFDIRSAL